MGSLTWSDSTGLRTASHYFSFIYLPLIRNPHFRTNLKTFVNEISITRFLPFTMTVSSNREWSALDFTLLGTVGSPRQHLYHSQLINKLAHANNSFNINFQSCNFSESTKIKCGSSRCFSQPIKVLECQQDTITSFSPRNLSSIEV